MSNHAPGPWKACRSHEDFDGPYYDLEPGDTLPPITRIYGADGTSVAAAHDLFEFKEANARLIVASPEMFDLLTRIASLADSGLPDSDIGLNLLAREAKTVLKKVSDD